MGLNDWVFITPQPMAAEQRSGEVEERIKSKLADQVQTRLRSQFEAGVVTRGARKANAIRSNVEGGRIVITTEDDPARGTTDEDTGDRDERAVHASSVDDLFSLSNGVPEVVEGPNGEQRLAFRTIDIETVLGLGQRQQNEAVDHAIGQVVQTGMVDAFDTAVRDIESEHPTEKMGGR